MHFASIHSILLSHLPHATWVAYALLFVGMALEGEIVLFTALYLANVGYFSFSYLGPVIVTGIFVGDFLWYRLGIFLHTHPRFVKARVFIERYTRILDVQLLHRPVHTLFISKFTYGLNRPALIRAGAMGIPLTKFLEADIMAVVAWLTVIGGIGFGLSQSLESATHYIRYVEVGFVIGILAFIIITHLISKLFFYNVKKGARRRKTD